MLLLSWGVLLLVDGCNRSCWPAKQRHVTLHLKLSVTAAQFSTGPETGFLFLPFWFAFLFVCEWAQFHLTKVRVRSDVHFTFQFKHLNFNLPLIPRSPRLDLQNLSRWMMMMALLSRWPLTSHTHTHAQASFSSCWWGGAPVQSMPQTLLL